MIYFDNASTTKPSAAAVAAVTEALTADWGNPSSRHNTGREAKKKLDSAKLTILSTLGARRAPSSSLIFTGSGTEATNLAILGVCRAKARRGRILIGAGEHASVAAAAAAAEAEGFTVVQIPTKNGILDIDRIAEEATKDTVLASFMLVNNETGALYNVAEAFEAVRTKAPSAICHTDAVQGYLKVPFTVRSLGADMITVSAHKIHGPKGIGALYVDGDVFRRREISPVVFGGGQEGGFRSGTENVPGALGFAAAAAEAFENIAENIEKTDALRRCIAEKVAFIEGVRCNLPETAAPHILSITLPSIKSETMLHFLSERGIAVSSGSACSTHSKNLSGALLSFGLPEKEADTTIRVSLSEENTAAEAEAFVSALAEGVAKLARIIK